MTPVVSELPGAIAQQLPDAAPPAATWLAVECRGVGLLLPLQQAGEIFPFTVPLPVPRTRAWFLGVASLRGGLHGVTDLGAFLGLPGPSTVAGEHSRLVALGKASGLNVALLVDRLVGLRGPAQLHNVEVPERSVGAMDGGAVWRDDDGRDWQVVSLHTLAHDASFLDLAA